MPQYGVLGEITDEAAVAWAASMAARQFVPNSVAGDEVLAAVWAFDYEAPNYWPAGGDFALARQLAAVWGLLAAVGEIAVDDAYARVKIIALHQQVATSGRLRWKQEMASMIAVVDAWARDAAWVADAWLDQERRVAWAVRPLFSARAAAADIEAAAVRAADNRLPWRRVAAVLRQELARAPGRLRA